MVRHLASFAGVTSISSVWPIISFRLWTPISLRYSRTCSAKKVKKFTTYSERPSKCLRSSGFWVATPIGQVLVLHLRIITQPSTIRGNVPNENSSAPNIAMMMTSLAVFSCPSVCRRTWLRKPLITNVCCVSASPISGEMPAKRMELAGLAPVPPSAPLMTIRSALALATPAAIVPTPLSATSFTLTAAVVLMFFRSKMSCARSSIL